MNEHVTATLNGQSLLGLRIELRRGGSASSFEAVLPPSAIAQTGPVVLHVADAETRRTFSQFTARRVEALGDGRVRVTGSDLRESWRRPVRCEINAPVGDGTAWREGEPLSAQAAIERLFEAAGLDATEAPRLPGGTAAPVNLRANGDLGHAVEALLASVGLSCTVNDEGQVAVASAETTAALNETRLIEISASQAQRPSSVTVVGGPALELSELTDFEPVLPDDSGALQPLAEVLAQWGVSEHVARQACLSDGGFETLLPATAPNGAARLAALKRYAFRLFRARGVTLPWLPVGGLNEDGTFQPPSLTAHIARPLNTAPKHPAQRSIEETVAEPIEGFELEADAGLVYLPRPPFALLQPGGGADDPTLQDRRLSGAAKLSLRVAHVATRPPFTADFPGGEGEPITLHAQHLVALYKSGAVVNAGALRAAASELAAVHQHVHSRRVAKLAGVCEALAQGAVERVVIEAGPDGLVSTISERAHVLPAAPDAGAPRLAGSRSSAPTPSGLHQPINAFRAGPLVLRASGEAPEGESVLAVEALHRRDDTGALELRHPGPLAFPFFLESSDAAKFGRWFFVAGVEVVDSGRLRVLAPDERHAEIAPKQLFEARHVLPQAMRGLIVSLGDEPHFVDCGPLVADARGPEPGASSSLVYDLDGSSLGRRGGLQFLSVLALSPAHRQEGARDGGWAPALNLREGDTANPEVLGRGLFAETDGRSLGRLTATLQGGPILADADACSKHLYGTAVKDGVYRESAGHISTDAFFKVPGDAVHDAPVKFYAEPFAGGIPPWPPYEAQLKYDAAERHPWNHTQREGRWKIQYRVPFLPEIPPTWKPPIGPPPAPPVEDPPPPYVPTMLCVPYDIRPAVSEYELWAPSHDWVPAPSERGQERETPYPGPSIKSQGWAGEANGVPDPSLGGGCIYLPPGVAMPAAQLDSGARQTFLALHPEVVLAFGHPHFAAGRVHSGWDVRLATSGGHLELLPRDVDASTPAGLSRGVHVTGHLQVGPADANFGDSQALRLGAGDDEGIAFGKDVELYRDGSNTLRTDGNLEVGGKLGVAGLIDPTGLELTPQSANPGGVAANTAWIKSSDSRLYHGANKLAYSSELPALPLSLANGGTAASSADGAINELINNATSDSTLSPTDEFMVRTSLVGRKSQLQHLLATVAGLGQLSAVTDGYKLLVIDDAGVAKFAKFEDLHPAGANLVASVVEYSGSGVSGKTVALTGINRAHFIYQCRDGSGSGPSSSWPMGGTGTINLKYDADGSHWATWSLNAPGAGSAQTLTINSTNGAWNASGVAFRLLVIGTPT
ncbi:MAG: hypothetical protein M5U25_19110 [Planctomycetota bacterium]|nr:hypothetical protein [Planctomycetota bacterium]